MIQSLLLLVWLLLVWLLLLLPHTGLQQHRVDNCQHDGCCCPVGWCSKEGSAADTRPDREAAQVAPGCRSRSPLQQSCSIALGFISQSVQAAAATNQLATTRTKRLGGKTCIQASTQPAVFARSHELHKNRFGPFKRSALQPRRLVLLGAFVPVVLPSHACAP